MALEWEKKNTHLPPPPSPAAPHPRALPLPRRPRQRPTPHRLPRHARPPHSLCGGRDAGVVRRLHGAHLAGACGGVAALDGFVWSGSMRPLPKKNKASKHTTSPNRHSTPTNTPTLMTKKKVKAQQPTIIYLTPTHKRTNRQKTKPRCWPSCSTRRTSAPRRPSRYVCKATVYYGAVHRIYTIKKIDR